MVFDVKKTIVTCWRDLFVPHYCALCGEIGGILCAKCKNDNGADGLNHCLECGVVINGTCKQCKLPYDMSWMVGWRDEAVGKLAERYKYDPVHALARPLAELLDDTLPYLPEDTLVVPVPTNAKHIRQRGLDHTKRLAKELGRIRGWKCEELVSRVKNTVQVGASKSERSRQAKETFTLSGVVKSNATYLVVDDIWTTGATICSVCKLLKDAGAETVFVGVLARSRNEE